MKNLHKLPAKRLLILLVCFVPTHAVFGNSDILFESNFDNDTGYSIGTALNWHDDSEDSAILPPSGFGGVLVSPGGSLTVVENDLGGNALKVVYGNTGSGRASVSLGRHLTGDTDTGHNEIYVRYRVKLPPRFKAGQDGFSMAFWKWGRLYQNTTPEVSGWTENRSDSGFVVWGLYPGLHGKKMFGAAWADNLSPVGDLSLGSNGGPWQYAQWRVSGDAPTLDAHFQHVGHGAWSLEPSRPGFLVHPDAQRYHSIEWRFKLASEPGAEDGIYQLWIDGEKQADYTHILPIYGAPLRTGIPTVALPAGENRGFNHITLLDNMQTWADHWNLPEVDGFILIDDFVVSTSRIGHDYVAGNSAEIDQAGTLLTAQCVAQ